MTGKRLRRKEKMTKLEVNQFIEKMKMFGDDWHEKEVKESSFINCGLGVAIKKRTNELRQITDTLHKCPGLIKKPSM